MIIDTHAHIYSPDVNAYEPIADSTRPPPGAGTVDHLQREMQEAGVDRALLIQTYTFYGFDNRFIRDTALGARDWAAGVVNLDPANPHSCDALSALVKRSNVRALRISPEPYGYELPGIELLYKEASALGIAVNALLSLDQASRLSDLLEAFPELPVVLDHCLVWEPGLVFETAAEGSLFEATIRKVVELARHPNLHAKLTFLAMRSEEEYPFRDMHDACKRIIDAYGPERCVWGSDFPTELWCPKTTYSGQLRLFREELGLNTTELDEILGLTAERIYFST